MIKAITKERLGAFSDGVFAVIITIMVLQFRLPAQPSFEALGQQWPTALSYVVSYFLIVIMWINHHFLWTFAKESTPKLIFWNFVHMICASLVPLCHGLGGADAHRGGSGLRVRGRDRAR